MASRELYFCPVCGDDFSEYRCPRCGRDAVMLGGPVRWEACQVECERLREAGFPARLVDDRPICHFFARARSWIRGSYGAGDSQEFKGRYPYPCRDDSEEPRAALQRFLDALSREGWEPHSRTEDWYGVRLRRQEQDSWQPAMPASRRLTDATTASLQDFITAGRLGPIEWRMTRDDLLAWLGEPDEWGRWGWLGFERQADRSGLYSAEVWRYEDVAFLMRATHTHFHTVATIIIESPFNLPPDWRIEGQWPAAETTPEQFQRYMRDQGLGYVPVAGLSTDRVGVAHLVGTRYHGFTALFKDGALERIDYGLLWSSDLPD